MALPLAVLMFAAAPQPTAVRHLTTEHYKITITEFCPQPFDCENVNYESVSSTGKSIKLHGAHIWHECPGTHDPCHPVGYLFKNHGVEYLVSEDGNLTVTQGPKYLVQEQGKWDGDQ
jgi:hypothetical protein